MPSRLDNVLVGSPYSLQHGAADAAARHLQGLAERVELLRAQGKLTRETLEAYHGKTRVRQVAESNAIEGATLDVGETELAIQKGTTLSGHDPAYVRDARALNEALAALVEMARDESATDIGQLQALHEKILGDRPGAGVFRDGRVQIRGSSHRPPARWREVQQEMEAWEAWSRERLDSPAPLRATVLHAWLAHIHPFADGNGRTARALTNLELIRAGYPPIVIKKKERDRYLDALRCSDEAGDIGPMLDLVLTRLDGALLGLERSAAQGQGYDPLVARLRAAQARQLEIWNRAIGLFRAQLFDALSERVEQVAGHIEMRSFGDELALEDYQALCQGRAISQAWSFELLLKTPGLSDVRRLAWIGYRSADMRRELGDPSAWGPALFWSAPNPVGYPPWIRSIEDAPGVVEWTIDAANGNEWKGLLVDGGTWEGSLVEAAHLVVEGFVRLAVR